MDKSFFIEFMQRKILHAARARNHKDKRNNLAFIADGNESHWADALMSLSNPPDNINIVPEISENVESAVPKESIWTPYTGPELLKMSAMICLADPEIGFFENVSWCKPSFYKTGIFISTGKALFVYDGDGLTKLNGYSDEVHAANEKAGLEITSDTAIDYMVYYAENNRALAGPFQIVCEGDRIIDPEGKVIVPEYPERLESISLQRHFMKAMVVHTGVLFRAVMSCDSTGMVKMLDDEPIGVVSYMPSTDLK